MGLIKPIARKTLHEVIDFIGLMLRKTIFLGTLAKDLAMLRHFFGFFLTHRAAQ